MKRFNSNIYTNAVAALLVCSGIYGSLYSVLLIWNRENVRQLGHGFQTRTVHTADEIIQVVFVTQEERLAGAVTLMNSIVSNTKKPVHFSIITDDRSVDHLWEWIENSELKSVSYQVTAVTLNWLSKNLNVSTDEAKTLSYARLLFPKIFPGLQNRAILLEDDILVQGDISELYHTSIRPGHVGACSSDCQDSSENQGNLYGNLIYVHKSPLRVLQLNSSACAFSISVCVIDIQQWEWQNISGNAIHWIQLNRKTKLYKGQDLLPALLIALNKKVSYINGDWHVRKLGVHHGSHYDQDTLHKAKLIHWNDIQKPWTMEADDSVKLWNNYFIPDPKIISSHPEKLKR